MLIIQSISTIWGKLSRGGPAAGLRNRTPERFPLRIPDHIPTRRIEVVLHEIRFGESREFGPLEKVEFRAFEPSIELGCLSFAIEGGAYR